MLIPPFLLSQDAKTLTVTIMARCCNLNTLEVEAEDTTFLFSCYPYYLRLNLPGRIVNNENTKSKLNSDTGELTFCFDKAIEGEMFQDLEFITKFLVKKVDAAYGHENEEAKIKMMSGHNVEEVDGTCVDMSHVLAFGFGFALLGSTKFQSVHFMYFDIIKVNPFKEDLKSRRQLRMKEELSKFDESHYIGNLTNVMDDVEEVIDIIKQIVPWAGLDESTLTFNSKEIDFLKELPNKDYKLTDVQINFVHNTLIDILYAYCYDRRVVGYEENCESGWNINTLSASLSWLDVFESPRETLVFAFRRSLIYPLYRNFNLSMEVLKDLKLLLRLGEKFIIKRLIEIYYIFLYGDSGRYILNNLFIKDYITYVMKWDKHEWQKFLKSFEKVEITKADLGLDLENIEQKALVEAVMAYINFKEGDSDDDESEPAEESEAKDVKLDEKSTNEV